MNRRGFLGRLIKTAAVVAVAPIVKAAELIKVTPPTWATRTYYGTKLTKKEWMELDDIIIQSSRLQLRRWADSQAGALNANEQPGRYGQGMGRPHRERAGEDQPGVPHG